MSRNGPLPFGATHTRQSLQNNCRTPLQRRHVAESMLGKRLKIHLSSASVQRSGGPGNLSGQAGGRMEYVVHAKSPCPSSMPRKCGILLDLLDLNALSERIPSGTSVGFHTHSPTVLISTTVLVGVVPVPVSAICGAGPHTSASSLCFSVCADLVHAEKEESCPAKN